MSLQSIYEGFLAAPKVDTLAQDAGLSYITTLTSFSDSAPIIKHLEAQRRVVRKKQEKILNVIADQHALFLEVETVLEFVSSGGAYLPGLDDNFLADQVVVLPIQHVVQFNSDGKIKHIRLYWDQASLLKSVEVIGSRAKSWPIKDGKDQIRLITSFANAAEFQDNSTNNSRRQSSARPTKDPHGTLEPFAANIVEEDEGVSSFGTPEVRPRASARPPTRDLNELLINEEEPPARGISPSKDTIASKMGAGKNFRDNRLFGEAQSPSDEIQAKFISPHPAKFKHFDFHDGHADAPPEPSVPKPNTKHQSQWDFSDFTTPAKLPTRRQDQRTFTFNRSPEESPVRKPYVAQARRDAEKHFEMEDESDSESSRLTGHQRNAQSVQIQNKSLFSNNVIGEEGAVDTNERGRPLTMLANTKDRAKDFGNHWNMTDSPSHGDDSAALGNITNIKDRHKDFDPHFKMTDSPGQKADKQPLGENQKKAVNMMQANWESSDPSPAGNKENRLIGISGNGMGGRKGVQREWGIGDDEQPELARPARKIYANQRSSLWDS